MTYFQAPVFDLLRLGQGINRSVSRRAFAKHVIDLASRLVLLSSDASDFNKARDLLHDQIARLKWRTYIWVIPMDTFIMDYSIYPISGYEIILPNSVLGTALLYRTKLNSLDSEEQYYCRLLFRTGLEWACYKAHYEGRPNAHNDMPELDCSKLNEILVGTGLSKF